jgi:hypothetical protein
MNLLTIEEASKRLGLKPSTLRFWVWQRKIECVKIVAPFESPSEQSESSLRGAQSQQGTHNALITHYATGLRLALIGVMTRDGWFREVRQP